MLENFVNNGYMKNRIFYSWILKKVKEKFKIIGFIIFDKEQNSYSLGYIRKIDNKVIEMEQENIEQAVYIADSLYKTRITYS